MILITGASGSVGRAVLAEMMTTGAPLRALCRSERDAAQAPAGVAVAIADFADKASLRAALAGVDTLFLVCSPIRELTELESNVIDVAAECGVRHVVLNSALGAGDYPKSFPSWHRAVEDKLKASGMGYTLVRPNSFHQNILAYLAPSIRAQGAFYSSTGAARYSYLDVRDIAAVIAKALVSPSEHAGKTYELNGPEAVSNAELAARISRAAERPVTYVDIPETAQRDSMLGIGMPEWQVEALLDLQRYYTGGQGGEVDGVLATLLGRPPIGLDAFLEEFRDEFAALNPKTGMTLPEMKQFVRNHFNEFVNRKNLDIGDVNFAPEFVDHGSDVPKGMPPGPAGAKAYVGAAYKKFPDISVEILDLIAEGDKVVVRNRWTGTEAASGTKYEFSGIVIWRIAHRQLVERWAYLTPPTVAA
jgi:uncharacterized protein YbjT (DUF2867 family)/predicted SnoaL-like aldol condensation-catalyzing enzyme